MEVGKGEGQQNRWDSSEPGPSLLAPTELGSPGVPSVGGGHSRNSVQRGEPGFNGGGGGAGVRRCCRLKCSQA